MDIYSKPSIYMPLVKLFSKCICYLW